MNDKEVVKKVVEMLRLDYQETMDISDIKTEIDEVDDDARDQAIIDAVTTKLIVGFISEITDWGILSHIEMQEQFNRGT